MLVGRCFVEEKAKRRLQGVSVSIGVTVRVNVGVSVRLSCRVRVRARLRLGSRALQLCRWLAV